MTKAEAIEALQFYKSKLYNGIFNQYIAAFDVAIEALNQQIEGKVGSNGSGCTDCPVTECSSQYRGSECSILRAKAGVDYDPATYADSIRSMSDEDLANFLVGLADDENLAIREWLKAPIALTKTEAMPDTPATIHELKILPEYFAPVKSGTKPFEVRWNDRGFRVGDILRLREYKSGAYTGRQIDKKITYLLDDPQYCKEGFVILGWAE